MTISFFKLYANQLIMSGVHSKQRKVILEEVSWQILFLQSNTLHVYSMCISYQFTYLKIPRISTSRTEALTIGKVTSAGPSPTNTTQPPDSVALQQEIKYYIK